MITLRVLRLIGVESDPEATEVTISVKKNGTQYGVLSIPEPDKDQDVGWGVFLGTDRSWIVRLEVMLSLTREEPLEGSLVPYGGEDHTYSASDIVNHLTEVGTEIDITLTATDLKAKLVVTLEEPAIDLLPRFNRLNDFSGSSSLDVSLKTGKDEIDLTNKVDRPTRFICQPGSFTGDVWHVAAAMALDEDVKTIVVVGKQDWKITRKSLQFRKFYEDIELDSQVEIYQAPGMNKQVTPEYLLGRAQKYAVSKEWCAKEDILLPYSSTSILIRAIQRKGVKPVVECLQKCFVKGLSDKQKKSVQKKVADLDIQGPSILVNMRCAHYNFEHNITRLIFEQICAAAARSKLGVIRAGVFEPGNENHLKYGAWMKEVAHKELDIYNSKGKEKPEPVDQRETAYMWQLLAEDKNVRGIVGGRSGSLDIAAFMGVRTFSWDIVNVKDAEYVRMFMAYPLMSIGRRYGTKNDKQPGDLLKNYGLEPGALEVWMWGLHPVEVHTPEVNPIPESVLPSLELVPVELLEKHMEEKIEEEEEDSDYEEISF